MFLFIETFTSTFNAILVELRVKMLAYNPINKERGRDNEDLKEPSLVIL